MNKVFLVGRLVADPIPFVTSKGTNQSKITIAVNNNKAKDETYFFPCIAWVNAANFINNFLKKGDLVAIDGQLTRRSFISKQSGQTVYTTEIIIDTINSIGSKRSNGEYKKSFDAGSTNHNGQKKSIDESFPENIVSNHSISDQKIEKPKFDDNNDEIEWFDELNEKENK